MTIQEALKLNKAYPVLQNEALHPTHSYMFVSPDALTCDLLAKQFILLMTGREEAKDIYDLPFGEKVLVGDADFVTETAYIMPTELDKKYFVVHCAETANETAQNKLLKTLEEPPETAVIILICANEYSMLPTVRSRCRIIRPSTYDDEMLRQVLKENYPACQNPSFAVAISGGKLSQLIEAAQEGTDVFDKALNMLMCMKKSGDIVGYATGIIAKKDTLPQLIDALELILRDCLACSVSPSLIELKDNFKDIRELSLEFVPDAVLRIMPLLLRARMRINMAGNVNSIVDELLFSILEEKAKCQK